MPLEWTRGGARMVGIPGYQRGPGEMPRANCGCLVIGAVVGLIFAAAFLALGLYATGVAEKGWHIR